LVHENRDSIPYPLFVTERKCRPMKGNILKVRSAIPKARSEKFTRPITEKLAHGDHNTWGRLPDNQYDDLIRGKFESSPHLTARKIVRSLSIAPSTVWRRWPTKWEWNRFISDGWLSTGSRFRSISDKRSTQTFEPTFRIMQSTERTNPRSIVTKDESRFYIHIDETRLRISSEMKSKIGQTAKMALTK
jgi:hypothetical protein